MAIPPRSEQWADDEMEPREASWYNPASWAVTKDVEKGNIGNIGNDLVDAGKGFAKQEVQWGKDAVNFTKQHWRGIGEAALMAGLAATGVGAIADAGIIGAEAAGTAATDTAASATEAVAEAGARGLAKKGIESTAESVTKDVATKGAESVAKGPMEEGYSGAASGGAPATEATSSAATDSADSAKSFRDLLDGDPMSLKDRLLDRAQYAIDNSDTAQKILNSPVVNNRVTQGILDLAKSPVGRNVVAPVAINEAMSSGNGSSQSTPPATPPPTTPPMQIATPAVDTTTSATSAADLATQNTVQAPIVGVQTEAPVGTTGSKQDKILDLVEQFGLHPEDIKRSLTSWV